ncbi:uncharacterized protein LOC108707801 [Xenopus laevis]|uniref:Ig-like domain-containing protein n=2 Tax=Xenopus laevis TaxID=8355 RepID=A0A974DKD8_XENLA|nr:uncharacterized protein LOC108707801 [Xenopus laevis]OCT93584.1 hypothetical protein XELAEV_18011259mg [Xenopus laevis]
MKLGAPDLLRISTFLLLLSDYVRGSHVSPGETVTLSCPERSPGDFIRIINWKKVNGYHTLNFVFWNQSANNTTWSGSNNTSPPTQFVHNNFTDPRISFLSPELPLTLQILSTQTSDSANYSCEVTTSREGVKYTHEEVLVSGNGTLERNVIPISVGGTACCVAALLILLLILHWKKRRSYNETPRAIPQSFLENAENPQVVYENPEECYYNRFNTLYDGLPNTR